MGKIIFDISDNEVTIRALKAGNERAFEAVYTRYAVPLRKYAAAILKDTEEAFEVVQEVFVAVWEKRRGLEEGKPLRHYLLRAVHNNALRRAEAKAARRRREAEAAREQREEAEGETGQEREEQEEKAEEVNRAVEELAEQSRKVVRMSFWEKKKNGEIARELSISPRTVETILYKAKRKLREVLKKS